MSNFRTILPLEKAAFSIDYTSTILCLGSCFTQHIGQRLIDYKFPTLLNPFGIIYNPISIKNSLNRLIKGVEYTESELILHQELWHSFNHHGVFSHPNQATALSKINATCAAATDFLKKTNRLILTLGTATVFEYKATEEVVANCHKIPYSAFAKKRLTVSAIVDALLPTLEALKNRNPELEIIFTVSPVRHLKEGILENQLSKATLLLAIEELQKKLSFVHYFPAYELILDDLRDYRFFEKDMAHPNELAIQYVWDFFQKMYFSPATISIYNKVKKLVQASRHRPFHVQTNAHQQFVCQQLEKITALEQQYPFLTLTKERAIFQAQLT